eukprot:SAG31_NODE_755_length_12319_cov_6.335542_4_plen_1108_part_00
MHSEARQPHLCCQTLADGCRTEAWLRTPVRGYFLVFVPTILEKYGTFIARCNALIEKTCHYVSEKFPSGLGALSAYLQSNGMSLGLYTARGRLTCCGLAGSLGHELEDARRFAIDWNAKYVKVDSCHGTPPDPKGSPPGTAAIAQYRNFSIGLNRTGRRVVLDACWDSCWPPSTCMAAGPPELIRERAAVANSWRIGPDGVSWGRSLLNIELDNNLSQFAGPGHFNNPGLLISSRNDRVLDGLGKVRAKTVPRRISETQVRTQFSMFVVLASPLLISGSVLYMTDTDLATYTNAEAIAISQDPSGHQGVRIYGGALVHPNGTPRTSQSIWARKLGNGSAYALVFVNIGEQTADIECDASCFARLEVPTSGSLKVRDIWAGADLPPLPIGKGVSLSYTAKNITADECKLLLFRFATVNDSARIADGSRCIDSESCSLNGRCVDSSCVCTRGWFGDTCQYLNVQTIDLTMPQGYGREPNVTSWGGSLIKSASGKAYHLFATEETYGCGMTTWKSNSQVVHAVSDTPAGPFARVGVVVPYATNPCVWRDGKAGKYRMLVLPTGTAGKEKHCVGGEERKQKETVNGTIQGVGPHQMYVADSIGGPWVPGTTSKFPPCNNPSGTTHPLTGAAWLLCHGGAKGFGPGLFLYTSPSGWETSPASAWTSLGNILQDVIMHGVREGACEDPFLFISPAGEFHVLAHCYSTTAWNGTRGPAADEPYCSAHLRSRNASKGSWRFSGGQNAPYSLYDRPALQPGAQPLLGTRERPGLLIDEDTGAPLALTNGVSLLAPRFDRSAKGRDWTFTLSNVVKSDDIDASSTVHILSAPPTGLADVQPCRAAPKPMWQTYNLAVQHSRLIPSRSLAFPNCSIEILHPASGDPCTPEVTTCTSILPVGHSSLIVSHDRLSAGWTGPARDGAYGPSDTVFATRVGVNSSTGRLKADDIECNRSSCEDNYSSNRRSRKVMLWMADPYDRASANPPVTITSMIAVLKQHRTAFTSLSYQYFAICGEGSNDPGGSKDCSKTDAVGERPHLARGHPTQTPANLGARLTASLGSWPGKLAPGEAAPKLELWPTISYGNPGNASVLNRLVDSLSAVDINGCIITAEYRPPIL